MEYINFIPDNDYLLLTPGPLSTSKSVRAALLKDLCTWDDDYKNLVQDVRLRLKELLLANDKDDIYTSVLMQGSGTFVVESVIGSVVSKNDKLLVLANGVYGERMYKIASMLGLNVSQYNVGERGEFDEVELIRYLKEDPAISHVAVVHCETTTGALNNISQISEIVKRQFGKTFIVDAMSSLGGIEIDISVLGIDFIISSANKCIQGIPGFGFVLAQKQQLEKCKGQSKSLSLDLYAQWVAMEVEDPGKWRFTSPTHAVRAFHQALVELDDEGGVKARELRYRENHSILIEGMTKLGFKTLVPTNSQSPIITTFLYPENRQFDFKAFYDKIKDKQFVIYPGKVTNLETFRIGNIGHVFPKDMERLIKVVENSLIS